MTDLQKIKISIGILTALGFAKNQKEVGVLMGYDNESSFSQVVNGKVPIPSNFIKKLRLLSKEVDVFWESDFNNNQEVSVKNNDFNEVRALEKENKELMSQIIKLQDQLLDKSPERNTGIKNDPVQG